MSDQPITPPDYQICKEHWETDYTPEDSIHDGLCVFGREMREEHGAEHALASWGACDVVDVVARQEQFWEGVPE